MTRKNAYFLCLNPLCRFRFPAKFTEQEKISCPKCGKPTQVIYPTTPEHPRKLIENRGMEKMVVMLDNIRSAYNVGSIFRTADGAGIDHLFLCGLTPTPEHPKINKTALGSECSVSWSQHWNGVEIAHQLKSEGYLLWALENNEISRSLFECDTSAVHAPICLIMGNEICGIDPGIMSLCDKVWMIPMSGGKSSLNVSIAFGIAVYSIRFCLSASN